MSITPYSVNRSSVGGLNILLYGFQGVGKTILAASAQDVTAMRDVLFVNVEKGLMSVIDRDDIQAVDVRTVAELTEVCDLLEAGANGFESFKTVVIDSLSELQKLDIERRVRAKGGKTDWSVFGDSASEIQALTRRLRDRTDLNMILTALPKEVTDEDTGKTIEVRPDLTPALSRSVMAQTDAVWYLYTRELKGGGIERSILTQNKGPYRAKTRGVAFADALGARHDNPNMANIYDLFANASTVGVA